MNLYIYTYINRHSRKLLTNNESTTLGNRKIEKIYI